MNISELRGSYAPHRIYAGAGPASKSHPKGRLLRYVSDYPIPVGDFVNPSILILSAILLYAAVNEFFNQFSDFAEKAAFLLIVYI